MTLCPSRVMPPELALDLSKIDLSRSLFGKDEIRKMRELTDLPFGVNIAQAFVRDPAIAEFVIDQGVKFVTTSAGSPTKYTAVPRATGSDTVSAARQTMIPPRVEPMVGIRSSSPTMTARKHPAKLRYG